MSEKSKKVSVTTKLEPRDYLAIERIAVRKNTTISSLVRKYIKNIPEVRDEVVTEEDVNGYLIEKSFGNIDKSCERKTPWWRKFF